MLGFLPGPSREYVQAAPPSSPLVVLSYRFQFAVSPFVSALFIQLGSPDVITVRTIFVNTPLFIGNLSVPPSGSAWVNWTLPDNIGTSLQEVLLLLFEFKGTAFDKKVN